MKALQRSCMTLLPVCSQHSYRQLCTLLILTFFFFSWRITVIVGGDKVTQRRNVTARATNAQCMYTKKTERNFRTLWKSIPRQLVTHQLHCTSFSPCSGTLHAEYLQRLEFLIWLTECKRFSCHFFPICLTFLSLRDKCSIAVASQEDTLSISQHIWEQIYNVSTVSPLLLSQCCPY